MNHTMNWIIAAALAFALSGGLSGPSEIEAMQDVAAEVAALTGGGK